VINSKIFLPNKYPFQIKNHMQRTHLHVLCIYGRGDIKPTRTSSFPLSSLVVSWRIPRNVSSPALSNPARGECDHDGINPSRIGET
jgi:hypothetical protein